MVWKLDKDGIQILKGLFVVLLFPKLLQISDVMRAGQYTFQVPLKPAAAGLHDYADTDHCITVQASLFSGKLVAALQRLSGLRNLG